MPRSCGRSPCGSVVMTQRPVTSVTSSRVRPPTWTWRRTQSFSTNPRHPEARLLARALRPGDLAGQGVDDREPPVAEHSRRRDLGRVELLALDGLHRVPP